jgi:hypothetical protein
MGRNLSCRAVFNHIIWISDRRSSENLYEVYCCSYGNYINLGESYSTVHTMGEDIHTATVRLLWVYIGRRSWNNKILPTRESC